MTANKDHLVKIRAKSDLSGTGVDETLARQMCTHKGKRYMAVVEVVVDELHDKASGQLGADLIIAQFWPATDALLNDYLRDLTVALHRNTAQADGQLAIDQSLTGERTVPDLVAAGQRHAPHPFMPDDAAKETPICDVCGGINESAVHSTQEVTDEPTPDQQEKAGPLEEFGDEPDSDTTDEEEPWEYDQAEGTTKPLAAVPDPFTA